MRNFIDILYNSHDKSYKQVRIAVLDTGVDPNNAVSAHLTGYKDFVCDDDVRRDDTGHGTTCLQLICEMCQPAQVFALRVFKTNEADEATRELAIQVS